MKRNTSNKSGCSSHTERAPHRKRDTLYPTQKLFSLKTVTGSCGILLP